MRHKPKGRTKPYTEIGIRRIPCARCGRPSRFQWTVCANGNRFMGVCERCDVDLNRVALTFFRFDHVEQRVAAYLASKGIKRITR